MGWLVSMVSYDKWVNVGPSPWLWNLREPSDNLRFKLYYLWLPLLESLEQLIEAGWIFVSTELFTVRRLEWWFGSVKNKKYCDICQCHFILSKYFFLKISGGRCETEPSGWNRFVNLRRFVMNYKDQCIFSYFIWQEFINISLLGI